MLFWFFPELVRAHWLHADASQGSFRGSTSLPVQVQVLEWRIQASYFRTASLLILIRYSNLRDELLNRELLVMSCCFMKFVLESDVCIVIARTCPEFAKCIYKDDVKFSLIKTHCICCTIWEPLYIVFKFSCFQTCFYKVLIYYIVIDLLFVVFIYYIYMRI